MMIGISNSASASRLPPILSMLAVEWTSVSLFFRVLNTSDSGRSGQLPILRKINVCHPITKVAHARVHISAIKTVSLANRMNRTDGKDAPLDQTEPLREIL